MTVAPVWPALNSAAASPPATLPSSRRRARPPAGCGSRPRPRGARARRGAHATDRRAPRRDRSGALRRAHRRRHGAGHSRRPLRQQLPKSSGIGDSPELLFFDRARLTAAVVAAVGAHAMGHLRLVAVRALAEADGLERIVRAAIGRPRLGVSAFWIRHVVPLLKAVSFQLS